MYFILHNIGPIKHAEVKLSNLTLICGENNTGKTYATYAIYGFLKYVTSGHIAFSSTNWSDPNIIESLKSEGHVHIDVTESFESGFEQAVFEAADSYTKELYRVFAADKKQFSDASFEVSCLDGPGEFPGEVLVNDEYWMGINRDGNISIRADHDGRPTTRLTESDIKDAINYLFDCCYFSEVFPKPFILSVERTGANIFQQDVFTARSKTLEKIYHKMDDNKYELQKVISESYSKYPEPIADNLNFFQSVHETDNRESWIMQYHPEILELFHKISGGEYTADERGLIYSPAAFPDKKLRMTESSSVVRSLAGLEYYLKHLAGRNDILIIDEPELNLHPQNQRLLARLFARLVNAGIKVLVTTHSDYLVKELNTLMLFEKKGSEAEAVMEEFGYSKDECLSDWLVSAYITAKDESGVGYTLESIPADSEGGFVMESFDLVIDEMNAISDKLYWGE